MLERIKAEKARRLERNTAKETLANFINHHGKDAAEVCIFLGRISWTIDKLVTQDTEEIKQKANALSDSLRTMLSEGVNDEFQRGVWRSYYKVIEHEIPDSHFKEKGSAIVDAIEADFRLLTKPPVKRRRLRNLFS